MATNPAKVQTTTPPSSVRAKKPMWPFSAMSLEAAGSAADWANWVLIVSLVSGVLATYVIVQTSNVKEAFWEHDRDLAKEGLQKLTAEAVVARAGIATASATAATANATAANANLRAEALAKENLEIRQKIAARRITSEQHAALVSELSKAPATFDIESMGDGEAAVYASDIMATLKDAGWTPGVPNFPMGVVWTGLIVFESDDPATATLAKALHDANISFFIGNEKRQRVTIMIGAKPAAF